MHKKETFRGFTSCMELHYKRCNKTGPSFMSLQTFIDWFFGWASRMRIDFREQCYWCGSDPPSLACDGTEIGIGFKNVFVKPIETPKSGPALATPNRLLDRCFIPTTSDDKNVRKKCRIARDYLLNVCWKILNSDIPDMNATQHVEGKAALDVHLPSSAVGAIQVMMSEQTPSSLKEAYADVFSLLARDSCVDTIIPLSYARSIESLDPRSLVFICQEFCPEFSFLIAESLKSSPDPAISLFKHCQSLVLQIHEYDVPAAPANPILDSYNPPKFGRAYYFDPNGCQVRKARKFTIDSKSNPNWDDISSVQCGKRYPQVTKKGTSYLFLWFCGLHGHCYGFHVIPGSEERKDPASSLYTHKEKAPGTIFYDFSCALSEYCHNRESGFLAETKYFHDVFHGFSHSCSSTFKSSRLKQYDAVNSSICEQFNSFLQKIKTSAKLMSQTHFTFYVQFFIHIWNKQKHEASKKLDIVGNLGKLNIQ